MNYDVFISYNPADRDWVEDKLLPRLKDAGVRVAIDYRDFIAGMSRLENIERAIDQSRRTIVVLSPAWLTDDWNQFESSLTTSIAPATRLRKLLPILLKPCEELPPRLASLDKVDLTTERYVDLQLQRLVRDIEDIIDVPFPPHAGSLGNFTQWRRWTRRYRRTLRYSAAALAILWLVIALIWELPPFRPRLVWVADPSQQFREAHLLYNSGAALVVGSENETRENCQPPHGLWTRLLEPGQGWQESEVGNLLCIDQWDTTSALSAIESIASLPADPGAIYVLTSHSGLLVSPDGGLNFNKHPAIPTLSSPVEIEDRPPLFQVSGKANPIFWVANAQNGLSVYQDGQWRRLDGQAGGGCVGLPELSRNLSSLVVIDDKVLIGTEERGLWVSEDDGKTCKQVFDKEHRYEFLGVWSIGHPRYLALVRNWKAGAANEGNWQLLDLCPRPTMCTPDDWQAEATPLWQDNTFWQSGVADVLVQPDGRGGHEWYLITQVGQIWRGALETGRVEPLPGMNRCLAAMFYQFGCGASFAPAGSGSYPYLLANDHLYEYKEGAWWRYWWP